MKETSNRSFGILFFIIFLIISIWPLKNGNEIRLWSAILSLLFLFFSFFFSSFLTPIKRNWIKLGEILGRIIAPIVMSIVYFLVLTPISLLVRIFGKDLLKLKLKKSDSYWIKREKDLGTMDKQF